MNPAQDHIEAKDFPERITVELTNRCNLSCTFCPRQHLSMPQGFMRNELFKHIVDECARHLPVALVPFFRGESLLHPDFIPLMEYAKRKGLGPIQITTNAMLLDAQMAEHLVAIGTDFINISLDTLNPDVYEKSRRGACYEKVVENVLRLIEIKNTSGAALPVIQISGVDIEEYHPYKEAFIAYWRTRADRVRIYVEHSREGRFGSVEPTSDRSNQTRRACHKPFTDLVVYWNGDVALCNHDWNRQDRLGNVANTSIATIWTGERYQDIRTDHLARQQRLEALCRECDHWMTYYVDHGILGELYEKDPHC